MRRRHSARPLEEGESYYMSMTDMMVGVLFIFIILLSFFALQYRSSTAALTQAKDAQTAALLGVATALHPETVAAEIDHEHHVVCLPADRLVAGDSGRRCFAYAAQSTAAPPKTPAHPTSAEIVSFIDADLSAAQVHVTSDTANGNLIFAADTLFNPGTADLSAAGQDTVRKVAASLGARLPCYGYGAPATSPCNGQKLSVVDVVGQVSFDAFSATGRQAATLSLERSVAFHDALTRTAPVLAQLTNAPPGQPGAQPLLRVAANSQSDSHIPAGGSGGSIMVMFQPQP